QPPDYYRLWREQTERAHALEGEQARLVRVCEAIVAAYNTLYAEMDSEYAAHFTALGSVVQFAGKAVGKEVAGG
ncbi:MAG: hypothetical protein P4L84_29125, partial [Isosphaeraceae bacterium]|nr:hypothetical protein [Isosphaeraceae bacterium]